MLIGWYGGLFGIIGFIWSWMHELKSYLVWRLAKDWARPTKRAIMAIIMQSNKTSLIKA